MTRRAHHRWRRTALAPVVAIALACAPRAPVLSGVPTPARIPAPALPPGCRQILFGFRYHDPDFSLRGEGVARVAPPDSVRLDFFVRNETVGGATLIGDSLREARPALARHLLPPIPLLWAALGVYRVPAAPDTVARVDGDTLRVEIGTHPAWRATFMGRELLRLDLVDGGRIPQWVTRVPGERVRYATAPAGPSLDLTVLRVDTVSRFNADIWR